MFATMLALVLLSLLLCVNAEDFRCLYYRGECVAQCPRNMHPYHTRCDQDTISQRTCTDRHTFVLGFTCGWSRCDCNADLYLDEIAWACVREEACATVSRHRDRRKRKRLSFPEERGGGSEELVSHIGMPAK